MASQDRYCELSPTGQRRWNSVGVHLAALMLSIIMLTFAQPLIADSRVTAQSRIGITKIAHPSTILPIDNFLLNAPQGIDRTTCVDQSKIQILHQLQLTFDTADKSADVSTRLTLQGNRGDSHSVEVRLHNTNLDKVCSHGGTAVLQFNGKPGGSEPSQSRQYTGTQHLIIVAL